MDENPYRIFPGETMTLNGALYRFFEWKHWANEHHVLNRGENCNQGRWIYLVCCDKHANYAAQHATFFRYFSYLTNSPIRESFTMTSLRDFVIGNNIEVNEEMAARYLGVDVDTWRKLLQGS